MPASHLFGLSWCCSGDDLWFPAFVLSAVRTAYICVLLSVALELGQAGVPLRWEVGECILPRLGLLTVLLLAVHGCLLVLECAGAKVSCRGAPMEEQRRRALNPIVYVFSALTAVEMTLVALLLVHAYDSGTDEEILLASCSYDEGSSGLSGDPGTVMDGVFAACSRLQVLTIFQAVGVGCFALCIYCSYGGGESMLGTDGNTEDILRMRNKVKSLRCLCSGTDGRRQDPFHIVAQLLHRFTKGIAGEGFVVTDFTAAVILVGREQQHSDVGGGARQRLASLRVESPVISPHRAAPTNIEDTLLDLSTLGEVGLAAFDEFAPELYNHRNHVAAHLKRSIFGSLEHVHSESSLDSGGMLPWNIMSQPGANGSSKAGLRDLQYFFKYAIGIYGWPLYAYRDLKCAPCRLCSLGPCCKPYGRQEGIHDCCCGCSTSAWMKTVREDEDQQKFEIFGTWENEIDYKPFCIVIDKAAKAIVLALRGTLSLNDLMTDLICTDERFPVVDTDHVFSSVLYDQLMSNTAIWSSSQWAQLDKMRARRIATEHAAAHACPPDSKLPDELSTHLPTAGCATNCGTSRVFHTPTRPVLCAPVRQEHVALQYRAAVRRLTIALGLHQRCGQGRVQRKGKQPAPAVAKWTTVAEEDVERIGIDSLRAAGPCVVGSPLYPRQHSVTGAYAGGVDSHLLAQMTHVWICHAGMIEAAQHTRDALKEEGLLELVTSLIADGRVPPNLAPVGTQGHSHGSHRSTLRSIPAEFVDCRGYRFVVTGHSLGAGTAALLAMLLRHEPMLGDQVECLAYSPPGGLLNLEAAESTTPYITSVVLGSDIIPRLSFRSAQELQDHALQLLLLCKTPKADLCRRVLKGYLTCTPLSESRLSRMLNTDAECLDANVRQDVLNLVGKLQKGRSQDPDQHYVPPMYPPGRILHIAEHELVGTPAVHSVEVSTSGGGCCRRRSRTAQWASTIDFQEIIVSADMLSCHLPDRVQIALEDAMLDMTDTGHVVLEMPGRQGRAVASI